MLVTRFLRGFVRVALFVVGQLKVTGYENIPAEGPYMIVVNHMSKVDPPLMFYAFPPANMRFFAAEKWENHLIFGPLLRWGGAVFINRGEVDRKALREALNALKEGSIFGLAPEGTRSKEGGLIRARDGASYLGTRAKVPILPVGISHTDDLGRNMTRFRRTTIHMDIGQPFRLPDLGRRTKGNELSAYTHLIMVHIAHMLPKKHWGYYADSPALIALEKGEDPWPYCLDIEGVSLDLHSN